jgi:hypothetical protein
MKFSGKTFPLLLAAAFCLGSCSRKGPASKPQDSVRFTYRGPTEVFLAGEFNGWSTTATPMKRQRGGDWTTDLRLLPGKYQYKFVVNGEWFQDPANPDSVSDGWNGNNSVMTVPTPRVSSASPTPFFELARPRTFPETNFIKPVRWKRITYPDVPILGTPDKKLRFSVSSGGEGGPNSEPEHLRFDLIWRGNTDGPPPQLLSRPEEIVVHLHVGVGFVTAAPAVRSTAWDAISNGHDATFSRTFILPWARNGFDEAWIECRLPSQTYWIEIPYGFTRNPEDPWPPTEERRGNPLFPAVMEGLPDNDRIVPWLHVDYDLGEIQNHWRLSAKLANPTDPAAEVVLYHEPGVGSSPWSSDTPKTSVEIKQTGARDLTGPRAGFYLNGLLERNDVFRLGRDDSPAAGRGIGWVTIHVDENSYTFTVPSSLFKSAHGTADPQNKHRISRADDVFETIFRFAE